MNGNKSEEMSESIAKYKVCVDDNFHFMDESERYTHGIYDSAEEALRVAKEIVDDSLRSLFKEGLTADELYTQYTMMGDDPFIVSADDNCHFSAWNYAKQRCEELCSPPEPAKPFDAEVYLAGVQLAGFHIEAGSREFEDYARMMIEDLGDDIRLYLKSFYLGIYYFPGFDNAGMTDPEKVRHINVFNIPGCSRKVSD